MPPSSVQLSRLFQQCSGKQVQTLQLLGSGMCNDAWCVTTIQNEQFVVKVAKENPEELEQNDLITEARLLEALHRKDPGLPIPKVAFALRQPMLYAYHYVPGEWMKQAWPALQPNQRLQFCAGIAGFHAQLHRSLNETECREIGLSIDLDAGLATGNEQDLAAVLADTSLPAAFREYAAQCAAALQATQSLARYAFCHNDSHEENILVQEGQLSGVVDFGDADYGDVHREFGYYALDYPFYFETILRHYEARTDRQLSRKRIIARAFLESLEELAAGRRGTRNTEPLHNFEHLWQQYR